MSTEAELEIANQTLQTELTRCHQEQTVLREELQKLHRTLEFQAQPATAQPHERHRTARAAKCGTATGASATASIRSTVSASC